MLAENYTAQAFPRGQGKKSRPSKFKLLPATTKGNQSPQPKKINPQDLFH
jgi:hypothetical protein